ncbi:hypothetical protein, partial [Streptomyces sp. NRRL S-481]|uniref:hypothetical protein n=1 Tax=Streptomyces sp. NRRL S-481 TaxID=1463911 RepID=UPI001F2E1D6C
MLFRGVLFRVSLFGGLRGRDARRRGGGLGRTALGVLADRAQHGEARGGGRLGRRVLLGRRLTTRRVLARRGRSGSRLLG